MFYFRPIAFAPVAEKTIVRTSYIDNEIRTTSVGIQFDITRKQMCSDVHLKL